ncbi:MAG: type VI secretion protein IcmF/TssM N-terminal domain-containing protein, partial [Phycisphaerae bacterium]
MSRMSKLAFIPRILDYMHMMPSSIRWLIGGLCVGSVSIVGWALYSLFRGGRGINWKLAGAIVGVVLAVALVVGLIWWIYKSIHRRRERRLEEALQGGKFAGPVSMDVRETVKANNETFFKHVRELKTKYRTNIYDLPWYVVLGDSGCGKTRLINESGLEFGERRPEGHRLGTLHYNWWFAEDAIFIDMAGRLCNPQEDADHKEWRGFMETMARGRPACPINGAIVCVSADHLLEAPEDEIAEGAENLLKRLRELQHILGVTFPTYFIVTKCDKILGFIDFFRRSGGNLLLRQQMFGWSREGAFEEAYNPETFDETFDRVYADLCKLRIQRLNEDNDEQAIGNAYGLPEEFRNLLPPLQVYISKLFPYLKNPRGVKNLIFRGVYF